MLKELIAECTDYDYKVSVETKKPRSWLKTVSAFANGVSGSLFFGISDEGNVLGLKNIKEDPERISVLIKTRVKMGKKEHLTVSINHLSWLALFEPIFSMHPILDMLLLFFLFQN